MKVEIEKIAGEKIEIIEYLSDYIINFKFTNLPTDIEFKIWNKYQDRLNHSLGSSLNNLKKEREYRAQIYHKSESIDELVRLNIRHCCCADYYFTNGQRIISVIKTNGLYQLAVHNSKFPAFISSKFIISSFSLESFELRSYKFIEEIYAVVTSILSNVKIKRLQGPKGYIEIQNYFQNLHIVTFKEEVYHLRTGYPNKNLDYQFEKLLKKINWTDLVCCINCKHFKAISRGHLVNSKLNGDCEVIDNKLNDANKTTYMLSWCRQFEAK